MRVLIAPDSFGDTLTAVQAAAAMAAGWSVDRPEDELVVAPQSDGGPGFVDVLAARIGEPEAVTVEGPLGTPVRARWLAAGDTAYIESAQACGLALLGGPPTPRTAVAAHSRGVGQLIAAAVDAGATTVVIGLGGSGCTDGGRGLVEVLGSGADGAAVASARARLAGIRLVAATDVRNPLLGEHGAAAVFGPQKGADAAAVELLERRNTEWSRVLEAATGTRVADAEGAGAAGGIGAALLALGATRESGAAVVAAHTGQEALLASADLVLTGEGRFDHQSLRGKVVIALAEAAGRHRVPTVVIAGQVWLEAGAAEAAGLRAVYSVADHAGSVGLAMSDAAGQLRALTARVARRWPEGG
ncbi:glycerate kinase [Rhodococcus daqingensis]|uniref:Glycerate kinase n=1 Tax=Rhodococcus daqingensis TaxID=2479363 RepID=A0ABW2RT53_9NOCA